MRRAAIPTPWATPRRCPARASPELDELIAQARSEADPDAYMGLLQDICAFQNENAIEGSLWTAIRFAATTNDVQDFYWFPGPAGGPYEDHAELWTVAAE